MPQYQHQEQTSAHYTTYHAFPEEHASVHSNESRYYAIEPLPAHQQPVYLTPHQQDSASQTNRLLAASSYIFGWFSGIILLLFVHDSRYVRFHAMQSTLFFGGITLLNVLFMSFVLTSRHLMPFVSGMTILLWLFGLMMINCIGLIGWLVGMIQAALGNAYRLPFVGKVATRATLVSNDLKQEI